MDLGEWSCELESYVLGSMRGTIVKKSMHVNVLVEEFDYSKHFRTYLLIRNMTMINRFVSFAKIL